MISNKSKSLLIILTLLFIILLAATVLFLSVSLAYNKKNKNICETKSCIKSGKTIKV